MKDTRVETFSPLAGTNHAVTGTLGMRVHIDVHSCELEVCDPARGFEAEDLRMRVN